MWPPGKAVLVHPSEIGSNSKGPEGKKTKCNGQEGKVDGDNAKQAASIENREVVRRGVSVQKDSTDQKTRKDEEKVDAGPGEAHGGLRIGKETCRSSHDVLRKVMMKEDHADGDSADSVELRDAHTQIFPMFPHVMPTTIPPSLYSSFRCARRPWLAQDGRFSRDFRDAHLSSTARYPSAQFVASACGGEIRTRGRAWTSREEQPRIDCGSSCSRKWAHARG